MGAPHSSGLRFQSPELQPAAKGPAGAQGLPISAPAAVTRTFGVLTSGSQDVGLLFGLAPDATGTPPSCWWVGRGQAESLGGTSLRPRSLHSNVPRCLGHAN